jgi:hypothetical protein
MSDESSPKRAAVAAAAAVAAEGDGKAAAAAIEAAVAVVAAGRPRLTLFDRTVERLREVAARPDATGHQLAMAAGCPGAEPKDYTGILYREEFSKFVEALVSRNNYWSKDYTIVLQEEPRRTFTVQAWVEKETTSYGLWFKMRLMARPEHDNGLLFHRNADSYYKLYEFHYRGFEASANGVFDYISGFNKIMTYLDYEVPHMTFYQDKLYTAYGRWCQLTRAQLRHDRLEAERNSEPLCFKCGVPAGKFVAMCAGAEEYEGDRCCLKCYLLMDTADEHDIDDPFELYCVSQKYRKDTYEDCHFFEGREYVLIHEDCIDTSETDDEDDDDEDDDDDDEDDEAAAEAAADEYAAADDARRVERGGIGVARLDTLYPAFLNDSDEMCSICREGYNERYKGCRRLPCQHVFHYHCIDDWFFKHKTCPLCRVDCS